MNPFLTNILGFRNQRLQATNVDERMHLVRDFDTDQCRAGLKVRGLQKTVRTAIERRLRTLERIRVVDDELPPCEGEAIRDTTHDIFRRGCGVED